MANSPQSRKRVRQEVGRRARTVVHASRFRTYAKKVRAALVRRDGTQAKEAYLQFVKVADSAATKGVVHRNKAARLKRNLSAAVKALASAKAPAREAETKAV